MSILDYVTDEELKQKLINKKVDISIAIDKLFPFLHGLRDKLLITEEKFKEISTLRKQISKAIYSLLEWLELSDSSTIRNFWCNLFQAYNLEAYPKLCALQASLIEVEDNTSYTSGIEDNLKVNKPEYFVDVTTRLDKEFTEDREKDRPATVPGVKTELCVTGKRKCPDEEHVRHSASGRTQKDDKDQSPECSKDTNWKRNMKQHLMEKEDDKPNVTETKKRPSLQGKDFDSNELPVSCGDIIGVLDKKKLELGSKTACIRSGNEWYTPRQFEMKGGRDKSKNWKLSIRCKGYPLSKLLERKYLVCESPNKKGKVKAECTLLKYFVCESPSKKGKVRAECAEKNKLIIVNDTSDESSLSESESESDTEVHIELTKKSDIQCKDGSSDEQRKGTEAEEIEMADFSSNELPVTCGSLTGILHKSRFITGIQGKCIRTMNKWLTPSEFENLSDINKDIRYWKRNIHCKSQTLGKLIKRGYLKLHKLDCLCEKCTSPDLESQNDDECTVCEDGGNLVCCDECPKVFHHVCHVPSLSPNLSEKFVCTYCKMDKLSANKERPSVSHSEFSVHQSAMTPKYILKCEYILLQLYRKQECVVFDKNPCDTILMYNDTIEHPMWLCRVKERLAKNEYQIVGGFIDDMRLIFHNCARFNQQINYPKYIISSKAHPS
ncbi:uncharacterized protein LOC144491385 isoform X2 [Mustelus asterias]